jgi:hypothetical protein
MSLPGLSLVINCILCLYIVLINSLVLRDLCLFFCTYVVSFGPLGVGYKVKKFFDSGWIEYFGGQGLNWVLFNIFLKDKAVPLQAWSGPGGSRKLRFPDCMTTAQDGGKFVSLAHRPPLLPGNAPGTHFS